MRLRLVKSAYRQRALARRGPKQRLDSITFQVGRSNRASPDSEAAGYQKNRPG